MHNSTAFNVLTLVCAVGILFLLGELSSSLSCWAIYIPVALVAWPIWCYQRERSLLYRRAILDSVSLENSSIRRWLCSGHLLVAWQVFVALALALPLLAFLPSLKLKEVHVSRTALAHDLKLQQYAAIDRMTLHIQNSVAKTFIPARDGL